MEWIFLDPAVANFVKLLMSLGEIMFYNRVFGKMSDETDIGSIEESGAINESAMCMHK